MVHVPPDREEPGFDASRGAVATLAEGGAGAGPARRLARLIQDERARWFNWTPVLLGSGMAFYFSLLQEPTTAAALAPAAIGFAMLLAWRSATLSRALAAALVLAGVGFALAKVRTEWVRAPVLERPLRSAEVTGWVEAVEPKAPRGERVTLRVSSIEGLPPERTPRRARIRVLNAVPGLAPGNAVKLKARLSPPAAPALPGGYDFARAAWFERLGAVGYALARPEIDAAAGPAPAGLAAHAEIERLRAAIGARIRAALPGQSGAVAVALITGERGAISEATNDAFRNSGLFHILSISGMHMVIMAGAVFVSVRLLLALVPAIALRYPIKKWAAAAATVGAIGYMLLSGSEFATQRSAIMISIMFLAVLLDRPAIALRNVALAALVILVLYPESVLDAGFQMSFAAVVALVAVYEAIRHRGPIAGALGRGPAAQLAVFLGGIVLSTLVAGLAVAPIAAYHFHTTQHYAIAANLIAVPLSNLVVMPAALATLVLMPLHLEAGPLWVMGLGIDAMRLAADRIAALPGAVGHVAAMPDSAILLMTAGGLWLALWRERWRALGLAGLAAGLALAPTLPQPDALIGRDGALVAVRGPDGRLAALRTRGADYELERWLEHDGDSRPPREAAKGPGLACDASGCVATVKGVVLAAARHPWAHVDDCARARVLALDIPRPAACTGPRHVIDTFAVRRAGTHALYIDATGAVRIETVAARRGERPWSAPPIATAGPAGGTLRHRLAEGVVEGATAAADVSGRAAETFPSPDVAPRPEIEDDMPLPAGDASGQDIERSDEPGDQ